MAQDPAVETLLTGANASFLADLYARYQNDPSQLDASWRALFDELKEDPELAAQAAQGASWAPRARRDGRGEGAQPLVGDARDPGHAPDRDGKAGAAGGGGAGAAAADGGISAEELRQAQLDSIRALMLIRAYRVRGHLQAELDPLRMSEPIYHPELDPKTYGFTDDDWDRPIFINWVLGLEYATLREIIDALQETYCGHIGVEYTHIQDPEQQGWLKRRLEGARTLERYSNEEKRLILDRVTAAEAFEKFLNAKYPGAKRFGLDGGDSAVPALYETLRHGGEMGVDETVLGMPHRGRLNILCNIMGKPYRTMFAEFQGISSMPDHVQSSGDVKYHMGTSSDVELDGNPMHLSLTANPSHLEAVNPVVVGKVRAKQDQKNDSVERGRVLGMLMHGDAAFCGQGLVPETLALSELQGYRTGGTVHFIVNNQIGFTTSPAASRSGPYPTDVALALQAPIFHVNGDNPEAVVHASRMAMEFRQKFKKDVVVDIFCYRRHGHNEGDEPMFTQPLMYKLIGNHPTVRYMYAQRLLNEGVIADGEAERIDQTWMDFFEQEFEAAGAYKPNKADWLEGAWSGMEVASGSDRRGNTAVAMDDLVRVGRELTDIPEHFNANRKISRQLKQRRKNIDQGGPIDWAAAEALAFGCLLEEGFPVRLSGQDVSRGTFSQRHSVLIDQEDGKKYTPLNNLSQRQATYEPVDSPLSEVGVLGFEYGYTQAEPNALVIWEAQFGDFANGAQVIVDQFIASAEHKWLRMSGITMMLPHGYEGQGPEHSSARPERFLQLCAEDNLQVCNCTTPANYFHVLRRQMRREFRKPLILLTPKSLLRHKLCVSNLAEMAEGTSFHRVLPETDELIPGEEVRRVVLCTGKVYYDLYQERERRGIKDVAIVRLEQLYPWPRNSLVRELEKYPNADVIWCQEEPENMGYWHFVDRRIENILKEMEVAARRPYYVGRPESAAPATGHAERHGEEQRKLVEQALT